MRTYDIVDTTTGAVLRTETVEDTIRPAMLAGHEARLTHVDGEPAIQGVPLMLTDEERAALPLLGTSEEGMEYAVGQTGGLGERPDDAHPGVQMPGQAVPPVAAGTMPPGNPDAIT